MGGLEQPEPHIVRRILEPVQVAGDVTVRLEQDERARMGELLALLVVVEAIADRIRDASDLCCVAEEEVPPRRRFLSSVLGEQRLALALCTLYGLVRIDADRDDVVFLADRPGNQEIAQDVPGGFRRLFAVNGRFARGHFPPPGNAVRVNAHENDTTHRGAPKAGLKKMHQRHLDFVKFDMVDVHVIGGPNEKLTAVSL